MDYLPLITPLVCPFGLEVSGLCKFILNSYTELLHFFIPVVDMTLLPEIIALLFISLVVAISLFPPLSNLSSRVLANLNLLVLRYIYIFLAFI